MTENDDPPVLTNEEIRRLKKIVKEDERVEWLWALVRKWAAGAAMFLAGLVAFRDDLGAALRWLIGK